MSGSQNLKHFTSYNFHQNVIDNHCFWQKSLVGTSIVIDLPDTVMPYSFCETLNVKVELMAQLTRLFCHYSIQVESPTHFKAGEVNDDSQRILVNQIIFCSYGKHRQHVKTLSSN